MLTLSTLRLGLIVAASIAGLALVCFIFDAVGDAREAKTRAEYADAARKKNVEIGNFNTAQEAIDALVDAKVTEALVAAGRVPGKHPATAEQAAALNAIRRAGQ